MERVEYNFEAWQKSSDETGYFSIVSSAARSAQEIFSLYRMRDVLEKQYSILKSQLRFDTTRVHTDTAIEARLATAFIASILRTEIEIVCKELELNTNEMIRKLDRAYLRYMPGDRY